MHAVKYLERYNYDDYAQWEGKWELIEGVPMAMSPSPTINHQAIAAKLVVELSNSIGDCEQCLVLGEEDWKINESTVLKPDVTLICNEPGKAHITKAPLIIAEVVSASTAKRDEQYKFEIYEAEKVPYYILVYPDDCKAKIYKHEGSGYSKEGDFFAETYKFTDMICPAAINFDQVFKMFRK